VTVAQTFVRWSVVATLLSGSAAALMGVLRDPLSRAEHIEIPSDELLAYDLEPPGSVVIGLLPKALEPNWQRFTRKQRKDIERAGEDERRALADSTVRWFRAHGYPFAKARVLARVDSAANRADLAVQVDPGGRYRIGRIQVTGTKTIPQHEVVRQLSVHAGQWFDAQALEEARQQITQMDVVRLASVDVARDSAGDTTVVVMLRMAENPQYPERLRWTVLSAADELFRAAR